MVWYTLDGNKRFIDITKATRRDPYAHLYTETPDFWIQKVVYYFTE